MDKYGLKIKDFKPGPLNMLDELDLSKWSTKLIDLTSVYPLCKKNPFYVKSRSLR